MDVIDRPSAQGDEATRPQGETGSAGADSRMDGVEQELAQAVSRGDVSREQADAFLGRLLGRIVGPRSIGL